MATGSHRRGDCGEHQENEHRQDQELFLHKFVFPPFFSLGSKLSADWTVDNWKLVIRNDELLSHVFPPSSSVESVNTSAGRGEERSWKPSEYPGGWLTFYTDKRRFVFLQFF